MMISGDFSVPYDGLLEDGKLFLNADVKRDENRVAEALERHYFVHLSRQMFLHIRSPVNSLSFRFMCESALYSLVHERYSMIYCFSFYAFISLSSRFKI